MEVGPARRDQIEALGKFAEFSGMGGRMLTVEDFDPRKANINQPPQKILEFQSTLRKPHRVSQCGPSPTLSDLLNASFEGWLDALD